LIGEGILKREPDQHLDDDEIELLVSPNAERVDSQTEFASALREAARHLEACEACRRTVQMHTSVQDQMTRFAAGDPARGPDCLDANRWLEVAAGFATEDRLKHAAECGHCGPLLKQAVQILADEAAPHEEAAVAGLATAKPEWQRNMVSTIAGAARNSANLEPVSKGWKSLIAFPRFALAASIVAVIAIAGWLGYQRLRPPSAEKLLAEAYSEQRLTEARIIPSAKYAPLRVERGAGSSNLDRPASLLRAELLIRDRLGRNPNDPSWLEAKAQADLLDGNFDSAIHSLQQALETRSKSPTLLRNLGTSYFERAESTRSSIDYGNAVEYLGRALAKTPDDPVALFNRALACERMFLFTQAIDDWEHYLRIDPSSDWAAEARKHLTALKEKVQIRRQSFREPLLDLATIARGEYGSRGDLGTQLEARIEEYQQDAIEYWLPEAYPIPSGRTEQSRDARAGLRLLSQIAIQKHGDHWLGDLLGSSSSPDFPRAVSEISKAAISNDSGDNDAARKHAANAEKLFVGQPAGRLRARLEYVFGAHDAQDGNQCLHGSRLLEQTLTHAPYPWLRAESRIEQGTCEWFLGNLGGAKLLYEQAETDAKASNYKVLSLRTQDHLAALASETGDFAASASRAQESLSAFWDDRFPPMRGYNLYFDIYEFSRLTGRSQLEVAAWRDGVALSETFTDNVMRAMAHSAMADAAVSASMPALAESEFMQAGAFFEASPRIRSTQIARIEAEARLASVEILQGRPADAVSRLSSFAPQVETLSDKYLQILFDTTMGDAQSRLGQEQQAFSHLTSAVSLAEFELFSLEGDRAKIGWELETRNAYRSLVGLQLRRGFSSNALEIWELFRGAAARRATASNATRPSIDGPLDPREVESRLPLLTSETVVAFALLPDGLAVWTYDDRGIFGDLHKAAVDSILGNVDRFRRLCSDRNSDLTALRREGRALYDLLILPIEDKFSSNRALFVELDDQLAGLPLEALVDPHGHYFGEMHTISISPGMYYRSKTKQQPIRSNSSVLVVSVSSSRASPEYSLAALPDVEAEGEIVAGEFQKALRLSGNNATRSAVLSWLPFATVFHFAGHALNSPPNSGLAVADDLLTSKSLENVAMPRLRLAVLSACETQGGEFGLYEPDSLARVLLRAGVPHVVASRWSVDSVATREYMEYFYEALLRNATPSEATRQAQFRLRSIAGKEHPYFWSAFASFDLVETQNSMRKTS
jgi:tetratricopeptide (TPR) repeat protein